MTPYPYITFRGAEAEQMEQTVVGILKEFLQSGLRAQPYSGRLAEWGAVELASTPEESKRYISSARPFIFISIPDGAHARELHREMVAGKLVVGTRHVIDVVAEVCVSERCFGALEPLRDALSDVVSRNRRNLYDLGLTEAAISPTTHTTAGVQMLNPYTIRVATYSLPIPEASASQP